MNLARSIWSSRIALFTCAALLSLALPVSAQVEKSGGQLPGDCNQDGARDLSDAICLFQFLFQNKPPSLPCGESLRDAGNVLLLDWNGDKKLDISDPIKSLQFLFRSTSGHALGEDCVPIVGCSEMCARPEVFDIERIQPFQLEQSFTYYWRGDQPDVRSGLLVVFKVNPNLVTPTNALEPVLYAGNQTVQRINHGHESGFVLGIIPEQIDLSGEPVWFGAPDLPERIDAETIATERAEIERSGIFLTLSSTDIQERTQSPVVASDLTALLRGQAANLLLEFSPQEQRLADSWRLPDTTP